ncbi:MAG TPA: SulP family inorganic anion transporter [Steroidobacteraceae bacterium]|nr:SulP family inorganic anion transporter [Steroidobacteraceae bacterium]
MTYRRVANLADILAALSIAGLLLPEAVAYSGLANLPPQAGVIGLFAGLICYGLVGRSRFAIVTATSSSAAVMAAATSALGAGDEPARVLLATLLVPCTGLAFVLAASARLGAISNLIARPVLRGFAFGLALVIAVKQIPALAGLHTHSGNFFPLLLEVVRTLVGANPAALAAGLAALVGLFALERVRRVPGALVVIVAGIAASGWLSTHGVALTGPIQLSLTPPRIALPAHLAWPQLIEFALALMFILYAESYSSIRTFALKHDETVQPNRDLLALGLANIVSGLFHGTPVGAGYSGTSANDAAGAQSRAAGLVAALIILVLVLLCLPLIERIPAPVLAAIVIHAVSKSLRLGPMRIYFRLHRDRLITVIAIIAVLVFGMLNGLLFAIAFSLAMLLQALARPRLAELGRLGNHDFVSVERFPHSLRTPDVLVLRPEEPLLFANADPVMTLARVKVQHRQSVKLVVVSLEESPDLDSSSVECLSEFSTWLSARHIELRLARVKDNARDALLRADIAQLPPATLEYSSVDDAVSGNPTGVTSTQTESL